MLLVARYAGKPGRECSDCIVLDTIHNLVSHCKVVIVTTSEKVRQGTEETITISSDAAGGVVTDHLQWSRD